MILYALNVWQSGHKRGSMLCPAFKDDEGERLKMRKGIVTAMKKKKKKKEEEEEEEEEVEKGASGGEKGKS